MNKTNCPKCGNDAAYQYGNHGGLCICCVYQIANPNKKPSCNIIECKNCGNGRSAESVHVKLGITLYKDTEGHLCLCLSNNNDITIYFRAEDASIHQISKLISNGNDYLTNGEVSLKISKEN